jgi:RHS repeat-associated protein
LHRARASAKLASTQNRFTPGRAVFVSCSQLADASTQNALHFDEWASGGSFDKETNLNYNYHRWYDPLTGRYTTFDRIGLRGGINGYAYVGGNPVSRKDPKGLTWELELPSPSPPSPTRPDGRPWGWGCGDFNSDAYVPDFFPNACRKHDKCYEDQCGKKICDANFFRDMKTEWMPNGERGIALPWLYYKAVDWFGDDAYSAAGKK